MSNDRGNGNGTSKPGLPGRDAAKPLPRRFYKLVEVGPADASGGRAILLDGRTVRTPGKRELRLASRALAEAVATEWDVQRTAIDPATMPLTRLVNTAIDGVETQKADVAADIIKYAGSDLICYRADYPEGLTRRQEALWDPVLAWAAERHGASFTVASGIMPVTQPAEAGQRVANAVAPLDTLRLTALHVMTTLMGSALLALAVIDGRLTPEAAWEAAHVDEDWQIAEWGEDSEAAARRERRWHEMQAASALARLVAA
jgi:chaperone required for assembly of F1-ATPase